ncbi:MAG: hypothetical protein IK088_05045 [Lachnospiraceae bacterium]|nr:hypothetical protein [Lachnospiraceae bacterium]
MELAGLWKVEKAMRFTDDGVVYSTREETLAADPEADVELFDMQYLFGEDGSIALVTKIPEGMSEEEIEEAIKEEGLERYDETHVAVKEGEKWKEEDGKIFYRTAMHGEILGEEIDPWAEITLDEDGLLSMPLFKMSRV